MNEESLGSLWLAVSVFMADYANRGEFRQKHFFLSSCRAHFLVEASSPEGSAVFVLSVLTLTFQIARVSCQIFILKSVSASAFSVFLC